jgi:ABC-2 type transport system ATP-binding protein
MILVRDIVKHYRVRRSHGGPMGALRDLFAPQHDVVRAIDGISFEIAAGEMVGCLGPNGAGKSTTIRMLAGLLAPDAGELRVLGRVPWRERRAHVAQIGAVFGQRTTLWWDLPVIESFELQRHIYSIPRDRFERNLREFDELLELGSFLRSPVRTLSLGQRMRADICAALLHGPQLLFLDEPTIGLDVVARERIRQFILRLNRERGVTVLLTTHDMQDVEQLCRRALIIDHGRLLFDDALDALVRRFGGRRVLVVEFARPCDAPHIDGADLVERTERRAAYEFDRATPVAELIARIGERAEIADIQLREPDIESTLRRAYGNR